MRAHGEARPNLAWLAPLLLMSLALALASCAKPQRAAESLLDTPDHHTLRGNDFLDQDQWDQADQEFNQALSLDRNYGPALSGKAVVTAHNATLPGLTKDQRSDKIDQAQSLAKKGLSNAKGDDQERAAYVARLRVYTITKDPDSWLKKARSDFEDAVDLDKTKQDADPYFFMARAYRDSYVSPTGTPEDVQKATELYQQVLSMHRGRVAQADQELAVVQKIVRAAP
ncbi:MAG TPA: hypothetical protein VL359_13045, partial [bacterium]|nr:hypothetical protein [bacterium]